jgi:hypothetical protein
LIVCRPVASDLEAVVLAAPGCFDFSSATRPPVQVWTRFRHTQQVTPPLPGHQRPVLAHCTQFSAGTLHASCTQFSAVTLHAIQCWHTARYSVLAHCTRTWDCTASGPLADAQKRGCSDLWI